jgi:hypothetical protein
MGVNLTKQRSLGDHILSKIRRRVSAEAHRLGVPLDTLVRVVLLEFFRQRPNEQTRIMRALLPSASLRSIDLAIFGLERWFVEEMNTVQTSKRG